MYIPNPSPLAMSLRDYSSFSPREAEYENRSQVIQSISTENWRVAHVELPYKILDTHLLCENNVVTFIWGKRGGAKQSQIIHSVS